MRLTDYEAHLARELCWTCHVPTHRSHQAQRQCPKCRKKWSYRRRQIELRLLRAFATGINVKRAAAQVGVAYRTAWTHFLTFERIAHRTDAVSALFWFAQARKAGLQAPFPENLELVETIYRQQIRPGTPLT